MSTALLLPGSPPSLLEDTRTVRKLEINLKRNRAQDHTSLLDEAAGEFRYSDCQNEYWNPETHSFLYGTPLWEQSSSSQRMILNHLYWVAYYSQIISAEIATIFFNQTAAAGLYAVEDFRLVCDTLDLESTQERAHIHAFQTVSRQVEEALFGKPVFTYPMRSPYVETMIHADTNVFKRWWKRLQLQTFGLLSSGNAFIACQYFTIRGVRTLSGKLTQHQLSQTHLKHSSPEVSPVPAKISHYHFMDESFHFNSSTIISHDVVNSLRPPTRFEKQVVNMALWGCQKDHSHFSACINGIFWYEPATFQAVYKVLRSPVFSMDAQEAREMMASCFTRENDGIHACYQTHRTAIESYRAYVDTMDYVTAPNKAMALMEKVNIPDYLEQNRQALARFHPHA